MPETQVTLTGNADNISTTTDVIGGDTEYVLLSRDDSGLWDEEARKNARSAEGAIRALKKEGTYVAIPARSFKPVTVQAVQTTVLKLEDAT